MRRDRATAAVTALLLGAAAAALYAPVADFPFVNWDDDVRLLKNPWVRSGLSTANIRAAFVTEWNANWSPLVWISHMLDFSLYGMDAGGHHLTNLLLHAANVVLLFGALRAATGAIWRPAAVAVLFALHPVNVESVAWVSERKGLLATAFGLGSLWCYAAHVRGGGPRLRRLAVVLLALGLMAKSLLVTLPILFLLLDRWPLDRLSAGGSDSGDRARRPLLRLVAEKWPYFALLPAAIAATLLAQQIGGAVKQFAALALAPRLANAVVSYARYLGKLLWPRDLAVYYPHPNLPGGTPWDAVDVAAAAALLVLLAAAAWRIGHPAVRVGLAWYAITLLPMIGIVQVGSQAIADRYLYLPAVGVFIAAVWGVADTLTERAPRLRIAAGGLFLALLVPLALASREQIELWRRGETLFRHATVVTDANYKMHFVLANTLRKSGRFEESIVEYRNAIEIHPGMGRAHYNLAKALDEEGQIDAAIEHFRLAAKNPLTATRARAALGRALIRQGDLPAAFAHFREDVELRPNSVNARVALAHLLRLAGELPEAIRSYAEAAALAPHDDRWPKAIEEVRQQIEARNQKP
jgi:tetratricopeptide (TPR) repeat protein